MTPQLLVLAIIAFGGIGGVLALAGAIYWRRYRERRRRYDDGRWLAALIQHKEIALEHAQRELIERWKLVRDYEMPPPHLSDKREPLTVEEMFASLHDD